MITASANLGKLSVFWGWRYRASVRLASYAAPPLAAQFTIVAEPYEELLAHHGLRIGTRHARKHLGWALDVAAATAGATVDLLKRFRVRVLTAEQPAEAMRGLVEAYETFAWRAAA